MRSALLAHALVKVILVLVVVAIAQRRLGPSSSAATFTTDRALAASAVQLLLEPTFDLQRLGAR